MKENDMLPERFWKRTKELLSKFYPSEEIYLSGSWSDEGKNTPTKESDVDIYIFRNEPKTAFKDELTSKWMKIMVGRTFEIFIVDLAYKPIVSQGMERLI